MSVTSSLQKILREDTSQEIITTVSSPYSLLLERCPQDSRHLSPHFLGVSSLEERDESQDPETADMQSKQVMYERGSLLLGSSSQTRNHLKQCLLCVGDERQQSFDTSRPGTPDHDYAAGHAISKPASLSSQSQEEQALRSLGVMLRQISLSFDSMMSSERRIKTRGSFSLILP